MESIKLIKSLKRHLTILEAPNSSWLAKGLSHVQDIQDNILYPNEKHETSIQMLYETCRSYFLLTQQMYLMLL